MVNVLQSMALTDGPRMVLTPTYYAFDLYRPFKGATPLKATLQAPAFRTGDVELPTVQVSAARGTDGKLVLALVNLHPERAARVATNLSAAVTGRVLTGAAMDAHNTFEQPQAVVPAAFSAKPGSQGLVLALPPRSVVVVEMQAPR